MLDALLPKIIAHRGAFTSPKSASPQSTSIKENTVPAFEQAIALGADGVEFDVRSTQDQVLIIHHDPDINGLPIQTLTWAEVTAIDPEIPTLEETIACCHPRIQMDIEIKEPGYESILARQIQHLPLDSFVITSFYLEAIASIKQILPQVSTGFLVEPETMQVSALTWEDIGDRLQILGVNFIAPQWQMLETEGLARISANFPLWVWTVNQPDVMQRLFTHPKIAAIVTDYPDLALKLRSEEGITR